MKQFFSRFINPEYKARKAELMHSLVYVYVKGKAYTRKGAGIAFIDYSLPESRQKWEEIKEISTGDPLISSVAVALALAEGLIDVDCLHINVPSPHPFAGNEIGMN